MLKVIFDPSAQYRIYVDIKDTRGQKKILKLHEYLCNDKHDFSRQIIQRIQQVRSHEIEILGLTDLLMGAVAYANRNLSGNAGKEQLVARIKDRTHYQLTRSTLLRENKFNLFFWDILEERE